MDSGKKSKEIKLIELELWFKSFRKKEKKFREDPIYRAILEAIDRRHYQSFLSYDIEKDIREHHPELIDNLKSNTNEDSEVGRAIGSRLKQLRSRSMLEKLEDIPKIARQSTFAVDIDVKEKFEEYVKELLNEKE